MQHGIPRNLIIFLNTVYITLVLVCASYSSMIFPGLFVISRQLLNGNQVECPKLKCLNQEHLKINFSKTPCLIKVKPIKHSRYLAYWEIT